MTIHVSAYANKKELKAAIGKRLCYEETSMFGNEYKPDGSFAVARRPHMCGGGREFFARVTMRGGLIAAVE